jgi:hypothetical protein
VTIICAWCDREGKLGVLGVKAPVDDPHETHGICSSHLTIMRARWYEDLCREGMALGRQGAAKGLARSGRLFSGMRTMWWRWARLVKLPCEPR